jgi:chemosensory pili system protein ChpA (sensor histidine kinase/response regulator)
VRARDGFRPADESEGAEIIAELDALRHEASPEPEVRDSETVAARAADADDVVAPRPVPVASTPSPIETVPSGRAPPAAERPTLTAVATSNAPAPSLLPSTVTAPAAPSSTAPRAAHAAAADETLAYVHDDVDRQVLPIFLEEAAELFPQTGEQLRAWRRKPTDKDASQALQRTCTPSRVARAWPAR